MAYGSTPTSTNTDGLRVLVGDISTSTSSELLADADYTFFLTQGSFYIAAKLAANSLAAKFTGVAQDIKTKKVGDLEITYSDANNAASGYKMLASEFGRMAAAGVSPYAGGISRSDKASVQADTDRVDPAFSRGIFDNPAVLAFTGRSSST